MATRQFPGCPSPFANSNERVRSRRTRSLFSSLILVLSTFAAYGATMNKPDVKKNPNPKMRYEVTVEVNDAPGPFETIIGIADYRVTNELCVPPTPVMGARIVPEQRATIQFERIHDNVFKGTVYADLYQDEDYFGKGTCHWALVAAGMDLTHGKVTFSASLFHDDLLSGKAVERFFATASYERAAVQRIDMGIPDRSQFKGNGGLFSITMKAVEKTP